MAPEIQTETQVIGSAGIDDIKNFDIWALTLTLFLIVNPNLSYPCQYDVKELQNKCARKTFFISAEQQLKKFLTSQKMPPFLPKNEMERAVHYQNISEIIYDMFFKLIYHITQIWRNVFNVFIDFYFFTIAFMYLKYLSLVF